MIVHCGVQQATHLKLADGTIHKIIAKWGIDPAGHLNKPSQGGFGCRIENGQDISMWHVEQYLFEDGDPGR